MPAAPPSSAEEIETQRDAATQQAALDHADDPQQQILAQHYLNVGFDAHRNALDDAKAERDAAVRTWLATPGADGRPQTNLPPLRLWTSLAPDEQAQLLVKLRENGLPTDPAPTTIPARGVAPVVEPLPGSPEYEAANAQVTDAQSAAEARSAPQTRESNDDALSQIVRDWVTRPDETGRLRTTRPSPDIWSRLTDSQQQAVDAILGQNASGRDVETDTKMRDAIIGGLSSGDPGERARWAGTPLYEYKPYLSDGDFRLLADMQQKVSPYDGTVREGLDHPLGTLDQNAEAAIVLTPGRILKPTIRIGSEVFNHLFRPHPPNRGFESPPTQLTLQPGTKVDRYGSPNGRYLSPEGTPASARSMAPGGEKRPMTVYEILKPIEVEGGKAVPWHGQPGGGTQYHLGERTVQDLIDSGHLRPLP